MISACPKTVSGDEEVAVWRGMGQRPMKRSGTDHELSPPRARGVLDAAAAVRLAPLPVRDLKNRYFFA